MGLLIGYFLFSVFISFVCSLLEATLLSSTKAFLFAQKLKKKNYASQWLSFKDNINHPLSAILSLNTIANTIGAVGVGSQVTLIFGSAYLGIASGIMTITILIFSEILPKTIGAKYWRNIVPYTTNVILFFIFIMKPFVWLSNKLSNEITTPKKTSSTYKEELHALATLAKDSGVFPDIEYKILNNIIFFQEITAEMIMTPRTVLVAVEGNTTLQEIYKNKDTIRFSRIPVYDRNIDNIIGFFLKSDLLTAIIEGKKEIAVKEIVRPIYITHELTPIPLLFQELLTRREHISLIVDSYGGVSGIVTMEDIVETVFGLEIMDELDSNIDMQAYARDKWKTRAIQLGLIQVKKEK